MTEPKLLTRHQFEHRCQLVWADFDRRQLHLCGIAAAGLGVGLLVECVLPAVPDWLHAAGPLLAVGTIGYAILSGRRFDRMLRELGLLCPSCGARLAGSMRERNHPRPTPGALDRAVGRTGECQSCRARVLAPAA